MGDAHRHIRGGDHGHRDGHHHPNCVWTVVSLLGSRLRCALSATRHGRLLQGHEHVRLDVRLLGGHLVATHRRREALQLACVHQVSALRLRISHATFSFPHHEHAHQLRPHHISLATRQVPLRARLLAQRVGHLSLRHQHTHRVDCA